MTESLSDSQQHVLLAIAQHPGGASWVGLVAFLKSRKQLPADLHGDVATLHKGGLLATRGTYSASQRKAELEAAIADKESVGDSLGRPAWSRKASSALSGCPNSAAIWRTPPP